ncbi:MULTISPECIES: cold-shock protein [Aureibaculum]|nr:MULTISPECIES: cold shock domain-containing protein [Aureibaculum]
MIKKLINKLFNINNNKIEIMKEGTVKFFNSAKGFGFIKVKDSDEEIFVHTSNLIDDIREDDHVQFEVEQGDKGLSAVKVSLV